MKIRGLRWWILALLLLAAVLNYVDRQTLSALAPANDVSWAGAMLPLLGVGPVAPLWVSLAVADWMVKLLLAIAALIPFRLIVGKLTARVA